MILRAAFFCLTKRPNEDGKVRSLPQEAKSRSLTEPKSKSSLTTKDTKVQPLNPTPNWDEVGVALRMSGEGVAGSGDLVIE